MLRVMTSHTLETLELITGGNPAAAPVASIVVLSLLGVLPQVHSITTYVLMDSPKDERA